MSATLQERTLFSIILSASIASTIGGLPFSSLPVMLGSLSDWFALDAGATGMMGSICFAGYLAGTVGAPLWIDRLNWRLLTLACAAGSAAAFAASAIVMRLDLQYPIWAMIGFLASTMTCLGMRILSDLPNKTRALGLRLGIELLVTAAVLFALPPLLISTWKYPGAALGLAGIVLLLGLSALWLPPRPVRAQADEALARPALPCPPHPGSACPCSCCSLLGISACGPSLSGSAPA